MSVTYTWKITGMKTRDSVNSAGVTLVDAVVQTYWTKTGVDAEGNEGVFSGATPFTAENVPADTFVPFAELTEEVVIGWIQAIVVGQYEEHVNSKIAEQIADKIVATKDATLPWASPIEEAPEPEAP